MPRRRQDFGGGGLWCAGVEGGCRRVFDAELDGFRFGLAGQFGDEGEAEIDPGGDQVAVTDDPSLGRDRAEMGEQPAPPGMQSRSSGGQVAKVVFGIRTSPVGEVTGASVFQMRCVLLSVSVARTS